MKPWTLFTSSATPAGAAPIERLKKSLETLGLELIVGSIAPPLTGMELLEKDAKPVLYVDPRSVFKSYPTTVDDALQSYLLPTVAITKEEDRWRDYGVLIQPNEVGRTFLAKWARNNRGFNTFVSETHEGQYSILQNTVFPIEKFDEIVQEFSNAGGEGTKIEQLISDLIAKHRILRRSTGGITCIRAPDELLVRELDTILRRAGPLEWRIAK
jgi:hypothetical protein